MCILDQIHDHKDLTALNAQEREQLCAEIRAFLVDRVSRTGGHLASNLGVVELTVAIETVFDTKTDRLVFDVGHQSYIHKLLTGRRADFYGLRQYGGMAGFPKPSESDTDAFVAGHASSSVSIALGMARARTLQKENYRVVALLGDGAATGGMAYEGLNDAAVSGEPMIVILNDNAMSIDHNVGGMASHLRKLRTKVRYLGMKRRYRDILSHIPGGIFVHRVTRSLKDRIRRMLIPSTIFESVGFTYLGPVDGHDTEKLIQLLRIAEDMKRPVVLHVVTQKGRGYQPAVDNPRAFHGIGKFDPATGLAYKKSGGSYSDTFGAALLRLAKENEKICAVTAAMPAGTGLLPMQKAYPERLFDVGIAEEHAVSMAGGLAKQGMIPVVALYSTFLQRAYDMILQDICMLKLHVILAIDRAGLVGEDGETHHGLFDPGFLSQAPGLRVLCPASYRELEQMLRWAALEQNGPVAIRYPRGGEKDIACPDFDPDQCLNVLRSGDHINLVTYGNLTVNALGAANLLAQEGISTGVIRLNQIHPLPVQKLNEALESCRNVLILEEATGGISQKLGMALSQYGHRVHCRDLGVQFVTHGDISVLYENYGLDKLSIATWAREVLQNEN